MKVVKNSKWTFDAEQFQQSFDTCKLLYESLSFSKSSLLYIEVWKRRCWIASTSKRVVWSLIKSPMILCLIWLLSYEDQFQIHSKSGGHTGAGIVVVLVLLQTHIRVVEIVVVHFVQLSFFIVLQRISI